jgi:hypothetical protein
VYFTLAERNHYSFCKQIGQCPSTNYASSVNGFKMGWIYVAGTMYPPIISLNLPVVKARVPNQKRPREWRVGLTILGGHFSRWWTKQSNDGELAFDDAGSKKDGLWRKTKHPIFESVCSVLSMPFVKLNGTEIKCAKANLSGRLFGWPPLNNHTWAEARTKS